MPVSNRHILAQGATIGALGHVALSALAQQLLGSSHGGVMPTLPGPVVEAHYAPRRRELVRDYIRHVGGDPAAYKGTLPPHMFPQWSFGLAGQVLKGLPYPLARGLNGGCNMEIHGALPAHEPLTVRAHLESINDDGRRVVLQQRVTTSTPSAPNALIADLFVIVPLAVGNAADRKVAADTKKERPRVPAESRELGYFKLSSQSGLDFAKLTGDFNPVHWLPGYARAFGFPQVILHGFATMARALEGLNRGVFAGDVTRIKRFTCRFTKPLVLPARVGLYVRDEQVFVGVAKGGPAYLVGSYEG